MNLQKTGSEELKTDTVANRLTAVLFVIYLILLGWILLLKLGVQFSYMKNRKVNLIPFSEPLILNGKADVGEIILNVLIFVPVGVYAGAMFQKWIFGKKIFFVFLLSLWVESLQYILAIGSFDSTDIVTNSAGGLLGLSLFIVLENALNDRVRAQKITNILAAIATVLVILFLVLLKLDKLPIKYK